MTAADVVNRAAMLRVGQLPELGDVARYLARPDLSDLLLTGDGQLWLDQGHGLIRAPGWPGLSAVDARALAVKLIARGGRHIDEATPMVDVRLGNGIRVHAVLPPISTTGAVISIRIHRPDVLTLPDLEVAGFFSTIPRAVVEDAIEQRQNILISGSTGSGKTTLLAAALAAAAHDQRIVVIEDVAELNVQHPHVVNLAVRQPNLEGAGEISLATLIRHALRMRPDRIILGECRGAEIRELLGALNTGHAGSAGTIHVNSPNDIVARLEALGSLAGMSSTSVARQSMSAFHTVLHIEQRGGKRQLAYAGRFIHDRGRLRLSGVPG